MPIIVPVLSTSIQAVTPDAKKQEQMGREIEALSRAVEQLSLIIEARS